ncbi:MAG: SMP-30/gluconolactonase/LRE family protein [Marmoricola sp.]
MEVLATGLSLGESPRWHDGRLWVCDWVAGEVLSYDASGDPRVELRMSGLPFSLDWLPDGRAVLTCARGVVTAAGDGSTTPYGAMGQGWNEIVVDAHGNTFVNTPGFDLMGGEDPKPGTVWVVRPDGSAREVAGDVWFPNGMAVTPDGGTLIVAESYGHRLTAFDLAPDGGLGNRRTWADLGEGTPDGICLDADGAVWYADVPNRRCVRVAESGGVLETVEADRGCFACMLGGKDGRTLFVVAARWAGTEGIGSGEPTGQLLTHRAPAPHAGRP